ncbi:hypothetical protein VSR69_38550 [Paraburkholderia phytofirmans]
MHRISILDHSLYNRAAEQNSQVRYAMTGQVTQNGETQGIDEEKVLDATTQCFWRFGYGATPMKTSPKNGAHRRQSLQRI